MPLQVFGTPAPRKKSFGQHFSEGVNALIQGGAAGYQKAQQLEAKKTEDKLLSSYLGMDVTGLSPDLRKIMVEGKEREKLQAEKLAGQKETPADKLRREKDEFEKKELAAEEGMLKDFEEEGALERPAFNYRNPSSWSDAQIDSIRGIEALSTKAKTLKNKAENEFKRRESERKSTEKKEVEQKKVRAKRAEYQGALETVNRMRQLGKTGNLGIGSSIQGVFSPEARKNQAEYERLGKSLIAFASTINIRNQREFDALAEDLYDPSISDDRRAGILDGMERIIKNSLNAYDVEEGLAEPAPYAPGISSPIQEKKSMQSFWK